MRVLEPWYRIATVAAFTWVCGLCVSTTYGGTTATHETQLGRDRFASGDSVHLSETVKGDAIAAGGTIRVDASIQGDGLFAGGLVSVNAPVGGDLYAAGRRVELSANVAGNARIVGADIFIDPNAVVDGAMTIGGGTVEVNGTINQYVHVLAGTTRIRGTVLGDLNVSGGELFIEPSANVAGQISFRGSTPATIAQGARVSGQVKYTPTAPEPATSTGAIVALVLLGLGWWLGAALVNAGFWQLWPGVALAMTEATRQQTLRSLGLGVAIALAGPPIVVMLGLTVVGLPLALLTLCAYILVFPVGYVLCCGEVAQLAFGARAPLSWTRRLVATSGVLIGASVLTAAVPVLGPLGAFAMSMIGAGSLVLTLFKSVPRASTAVTSGEISSTSTKTHTVPV